VTARRALKPLRNRSDIPSFEMAMGVSPINLPPNHTIGRFFHALLKQRLSNARKQHRFSSAFLSAACQASATMLVPSSDASKGGMEMTSHNDETTAMLSRRRVLQGGVYAATAVLAVNATAAFGQSSQPIPKKSSQVQAGYQSAVDVHKCATCQHFQAPNACEVVEGPISEDGRCKLYYGMTPALRDSYRDRALSSTIQI